jgi:hypothetical protein
VRKKNRIPSGKRRGRQNVKPRRFSCRRAWQIVFIVEDLNAQHKMLNCSYDGSDGFDVELT